MRSALRQLRARLADDLGTGLIVGIIAHTAISAVCLVVYKLAAAP